MAIIKTNDNKNFDIYMNADMFIIPNRASRIRPDFFNDYFVKKALSVVEANNYKFDLEKDEFVEIWLVSTDEEAKCDNLNCHSVGFRYGDMHISVSYLSDNLPLNVLENLKEGDTIDITYPVRGTHDIMVHRGERGVDYEDITEDVNINVDLHLHITCNQQSYRYRRFGTFEETLAYVR